MADETSSYAPVEKKSRFPSYHNETSCMLSMPRP